MTTLAAMLGAVPLMIGMGEGAELRRPLGISIFGGLLVSQVLTLYTTPILFLYLERARSRVLAWHQRLLVYKDRITCDRPRTRQPNIKKPGAGLGGSPPPPTWASGAPGGSYSGIRC
jgi:hypothetical protein